MSKKQDHKLIDEFTKEEKELLRKMKEHEFIQPGTIGWKLAVYNDPLRLKLMNEKNLITKRIANIIQLRNQLKRMKGELVSGEIKTELKPGIIMSEDELNHQIILTQFTLEGERQTLPIILADIKVLVGRLDVAKQIIISEEEFEEYCKELQEISIQHGFNLFKMIGYEQ